MRAKARAERNARDLVDPPRVPAPLTRLPWDLAQEEFGVVGADFIGSLGRLLLAKDAIRRQTPEDTEGSAQVADGAAKDSIGAQPSESARQSVQVGAG
jgi:hypothetical protein